MSYTLKITQDDLHLLVAILRTTHDVRSLGLKFDGQNTLEVPDNRAPLVRRITQDPEWKVRGLKTALITKTAEVRWMHEVGGIRVDDIAVATDRETRSRLLEAEWQLSSTPEASFHWKKPDGSFVELSAQQIKNIAAAVRNHVQQCFRLESSTVQAINAGLITTKEQVEKQFSSN